MSDRDVVSAAKEVAGDRDELDLGEFKRVYEIVCKSGFMPEVSPPKFWDPQLR